MSHRLCLQVVPFSVCGWFVHMAPQGLLYPQLHVSGPQATFSPLLHLHLVFEGLTWAGSPPTFSRHCPLSEREVETSWLVLFWLPGVQERLLVSVKPLRILTVLIWADPAVLCEGKGLFMKMMYDKKRTYYSPEAGAKNGMLLCPLEWWMKVLNEIWVIIMPNYLVFLWRRSPNWDYFGEQNRRRKIID